MSVVHDSLLLVHVFCLWQAFFPQRSLFAQHLSWRARLTALHAFVAWLASSATLRHTRSSCKRSLATFWASRRHCVHWPPRLRLLTGSSWKCTRLQSPFLVARLLSCRARTTQQCHRHLRFHCWLRRCLQKLQLVSQALFARTWSSKASLALTHSCAEEGPTSLSCSCLLWTRPFRATRGVCPVPRRLVACTRVDASACRGRRAHRRCFSSWALRRHWHRPTLRQAVWAPRLVVRECTCMLTPRAQRLT